MPYGFSCNKLLTIIAYLFNRQLKIPNLETQKAMRESEEGKTISYNSLQDMFDDLKI